MRPKDTLCYTQSLRREPKKGQTCKGPLPKAGVQTSLQKWLSPSDSRDVCWFVPARAGLLAPGKRKTALWGTHRVLVVSR